MTRCNCYVEVISKICFLCVSTEIAWLFWLVTGRNLSINRDVCCQEQTSLTLLLCGSSAVSPQRLGSEPLPFALCSWPFRLEALYLNLIRRKAASLFCLADLLEWQANWWRGRITEATELPPRAKESPYTTFGWSVNSFHRSKLWDV